MKGFINLIKPSGMSSAYAVGKVKKKLNSPCGHMGTLDPMAEGVLPVGIGKTSRLFQYLLDKEKTYVARFIFGYTTDTLDVTGTVTERTDVVPDINIIQSVLGDFIGEIDQIPPKYSAKCIDGKRGYELARKGVDFELAPKKVTILDLVCLGKTGENEYEFVIKCKGGTYIRSLARDIAEKCGSLGVMSKLNRTACGVFDYSNGVSVEEFIACDDATKYLIPPDDVTNFPIIRLTDKQATKILNGIFDKYDFEDGIYRVYNENEFWGIGTVKESVLKINAYVR
ncbi:MAG: tRNA pseudouridine(55) synthase TruB [Clostridia bacterium]|nr:tRNA pseudouridine(55) synthase TruB [Clostridia bacterium]